jgi:hypothetical protein
MTSAPRVHPRASRDRRAPELATLLLELLRVVKARRLCGPGDPQLVAVFGRTARAWKTDLAKHGELDLHLGTDGFRPAPGGAALAHPRLDELLRLLAERGIYRICFTSELDADGLAGFVEALADDAGLRRGDGGFATSLYNRVPCGIVVNDLQPGEEELALAIVELEEAEIAPQEPLEYEPITSDAPHESVALERAAVAPKLGPAAEPEPAEASTLPLSLDPGMSSPAAEPGEPDLFEAPDETHEEAEEEAASGTGEADTVPVYQPVSEVPASAPEGGPSEPEDRDDPVATEVRQLIGELRACTEASSYMDVARRTGHLAERTSELDREDLSDLLLQALAEDAQGKLGEHEREAARSFLGAAMQGRRLDHLIERIGRSDGGDRIAASQLVLSLDDDVIPELLAAATREPDPVARDRIRTVLISMGDQLLPEMMRMLESDEPDDVLGALRLAGETQHPALVPRLADFLAGGDDAQREEATRSLVRVGGDDAILALARAVRSDAPGVAEMAIQGLGNTRSRRATGPLRHALDRALEDKAVDRAKEVVRALGRLGEPEVAAPLAAVLQRKARFGGRWLKELKVAAASALGGIPGDEAVGALAQAAHSKDAQLRRAAQTALDRRAQSLARDGRGRSGNAAPPRGPVR